MSQKPPHSLYENTTRQENDLSVKFRPYTSTRFMPHWHEHIELLYFVHGGGTVTLDGRQLTVAAGDLAVANGAVIHSFTASCPTEYYCVHLYHPFVADVSLSSAVLEPLVRQDDEVGACFRALYREYTDGGVGSDMMQKSILYRLMTHLLRNYGTRTEEVDAAARRLMLTRFASVVQYVDRHYKEAISTRRLAEMCYLSEGHFCRFFKAATGKTPLAYINEYRVDRAALLLRRTDSSITEVALATGFPDVNYFSRVFRKVRGMSPSAYRAGGAHTEGEERHPTGNPANF